jgi:hypothetical protein
VTVVERTRQQLDPSGSTGVASVTVVLSLGAFLYALVMMLRSESQISHPVFAVLALALLAIAEAIVMWGSMPNHAPFTGRVHAAAHGVALAAIACEAIGQWGTNTHIRDDWGPVTLGIILVALGPYRPAREIAASGIASALAIGVLTFSEVPSLVTPGPPLAFVVVAITPLLALCFSAAMFSDGVVASIEQWQKRAKVASVGLVREFWEGIARSVQQDRVTILNRDVLPFFSEVLARDEVTDDDRARAREIAEAIRRVMVEEVDRSWHRRGALQPAGCRTGRDRRPAPGGDRDEHRAANGDTGAARRLRGHPGLHPQGPAHPAHRPRTAVRCVDRGAIAPHRLRHALDLRPLPGGDACRLHRPGGRLRAAGAHTKVFV